MIRFKVHLGFISGSCTRKVHGFTPLYKGVTL